MLQWKFLDGLQIVTTDAAIEYKSLTVSAVLHSDENCDKNHYSQQVGRDPFLGRQNQCDRAVLVLNGVPNCIFFCFVGRHLPVVVNH